MSPAGDPLLADYPFISFQLDLRECRPHFWMLVGEARSKCEHIRFAPLQADVAEKMHNLAFARGVLATAAIEGNTLSLEQVQARMDGSLALPPSQEYLGIEIDNMLVAYNRIKDDLFRAVRGGEWSGDHVQLDSELLCSLNKQILAELELAEGVNAGEFRSHPVAVGPYLAPPAAAVPGLVRTLCEWLNGPDFIAPEEGQRIPFALIKAVVAHVYLEWIHPFGDGNGRLGRLVEFQILISSGVPAPAAHLLTQHYMATRMEYYRQLLLASQQRDLRPFLLYAAQGFVDQLTEQIKRLHGQAELLMWHATVDEQIGERPSPAGHRQRLIAIELAHSGPMSRSDIRTLTEPIRQAYEGKGQKTLTRDLNRLRSLNLVRLGARGYAANISMVQGMRPFCIPNATPSAGLGQ